MMVKICGFTCPELAYSAARAGADFIGLVFVPTSKRAVTLKVASIIANAAREGGAEPVAVFSKASAAKMQFICQKTAIHWVQLHGDQAREQHYLLPSSLQRIYVQDVFPQGDFVLGNGVETLDKKRDYLLFDGVKAGSGKTFDWANFSYQGILPWLLSGGLTADNIGQALLKLQPTGLDVSSGVETIPGVKDLMLIERFIQTSRRCSSLTG